MKTKNNNDTLYEIVISNMKEKDKIEFISHYLSKNPNYQAKNIYPINDFDILNRNLLHGSRSLLMVAANLNEKKLFDFILQSKLSDYDFICLKKIVKKNLKINNFSKTLLFFVKEKNKDLDIFLTKYLDYHKKHLYLLKKANFSHKINEYLISEDIVYNFLELFQENSKLDVLSNICDKVPELKEVIHDNFKDITLEYTYNKDMIDFLILTYNVIDFNHPNFLEKNQTPISLSYKTEKYSLFLASYLHKTKNINKDITLENLKSFFINDFKILSDNLNNKTNTDVNTYLNDIFNTYKELGLSDNFILDNKNEFLKFFESDDIKTKINYFLIFKEKQILGTKIEVSLSHSHNIKRI